MDKTLKKILIFLILVVIVLLVIIFTFFKPSEKDRGYMDEKISAEQKDEENITIKYEAMVNNLYTEAMSTQDKIDVEKSIDEFIEILNQKDFAAFYAKLSDECKKYLYPDFEEFKKKFESIIKNYEYTCKEYVAEFYGYECVFYPVDNLENSENNIEIILKIDSETKETTIILDELIDVKEINGFYKKGQLNINCLTQLNYLNKTVYTLEFVNVGYVKVEIDVNSVTAMKSLRGYAKKETLEDIPSFILAGQDSKIIELEFDKYYYSSLKPEILTVNITKNSEPIELEYYLAFEDFY